MLKADASVPNTSKNMIIAETVLQNNLTPSPDYNQLSGDKRFVKETSIIIFCSFYSHYPSMRTQMQCSAQNTQSSSRALRVI
jgi:hypothetical protein